MKKIIPWCGGTLLGVMLILTSFAIHDLSSQELVVEDPAYSLIAISWGGRRATPESKIYQIQVIASDENEDGLIEVSARSCRQGVFFRDIGAIGVADDMSQAIREFGDIVWHDEVITVGGASGVKGTFNRNRIERGR